MQTFNPVTTEGRMMAAMLMMVEVGVFGTFTAYVYPGLLKRGKRKKRSQRSLLIKKPAS
jgi:hypothetical protein